MSQKIHLMFYGDSKYTRSKKRLYDEAVSTGWFDSITSYGPQSLPSDFNEKYKNVLSQDVGGGFWIWKHCLIKKKLLEIDENDILIYLDTGCTINKNGEERFKQYIKMLNESKYGVISFQQKHIEKIWTTGEIFDYFNINIDSEIANSGQFVGGILLMRKTQHIIDMNELHCKTVFDDSNLITNYYNDNNKNNFFVSNRHDQSIWSIIVKKQGAICLEDETYFLDFKSDIALKYPFLATRIRC